MIPAAPAAMRSLISRVLMMNSITVAGWMAARQSFWGGGFQVMKPSAGQKKI